MGLDDNVWHVVMRLLDAGREAKGFARVDPDTLALVLENGVVVAMFPRPAEPVSN